MKILILKSLLDYFKLENVSNIINAIYINHDLNCKYFFKM